MPVLKDRNDVSAGLEWASVNEEALIKRSIKKSLEPMSPRDIRVECVKVEDSPNPVVHEPWVTWVWVVTTKELLSFQQAMAVSWRGLLTFYASIPNRRMILPVLNVDAALPEQADY
ncbi:hypothetical protein RB598_009286 [Gaeumannomyces tritici]